MTFRHRFHQVRGTGETGGTDPEGPEVGILTQNKIEGEAQESWIFGCSASILSCTVISVLQLDFRWVQVTMLYRTTCVMAKLNEIHQNAECETWCCTVLFKSKWIW